MKLSHLKKTTLTLGFLGTLTLAATPDEAHAYDMDCKVILCIAGGFPTGCGDAYSYMIKRITKKPKPLPPFGYCAMSDGSEYKAHNVSYRYLGWGPDAFDCPEGKKLRYRRDDEDRGYGGSGSAFCYTHTTITRGYGRDEEDIIVYHGRSAATPVNFELKITIEPGTALEFRSPLFRINWSTGYVSQRNL